MESAFLDSRAAATNRITAVYCTAFCHVSQVLLQKEPRGDSVMSLTDKSR